MQGPVDATFDVWSDFNDYQGRFLNANLLICSAGQVYSHQYGSFEGLHSVKVIGFGVQNSTDYWLVQNSWGSSWGTELNLTFLPIYLDNFVNCL